MGFRCSLARPRGGPRAALAAWIVRYVNLVGAGSVLTVSFVYGVLYLLDRRRSAHGWFALQGSTASVYLFFDSGGAQLLFGRFDALVMFLALTLALFASLHFTRSQFGLAPPGRVWAWLVALVGVASVAQPGPFQLTYSVAILVVILIVVVMGNQMAVLGRLAFSGTAPPNARIALATWTLLALFSAIDLAAWVGLGEMMGGVRLGCIGIAAFGLLQSVALSRDFVASVYTSEQLNERLVGQVVRLDEQKVAVGHLNEELRRQVLARSEQLSEALTRLASAQGEAVALNEGDVLDDRYVVVRTLGAGAMGVVYEVRRVADDARLALKVLSGAPGMVGLARFAREGKLAATVDHPNVVKLHDSCVSRAGFLFLALEFVDGQPLNRRRDRYGDARWSLRVLYGIARGLEAIHAQGIVHRDLKPANVVVREDADGVPCDVKITDFGISNLAARSSASNLTSGSDTGLLEANASKSRSDDADPDTVDWLVAGPSGAPAQDPARDAGALTETGILMGTPVYMAPERMRGAREAMTAGDIYGFGVIAFELLHRRRPFNELEAAARALGALSTSLPSAREAGIAEPIATLLDLALSLDPHARPTAATLADALDAFAET